MQLNSIQDKTSFQTRYDFIDGRKFYKLIKSKDAVEVGNDLYGDYQEICKGRGTKIFTESIASCTSYGLLEKFMKAIVGHYNKSAYEVTRCIDSFIEKGKAFAIGGYNHSMPEYFEKNIAKFREAKIPTTIFWGQSRGTSNLCYDLDKDTCYIYRNLDSYYDHEKGKFIEEFVDSEDSLRNSYSKINVADGDEVCINGQPVAKELINKNSENYSW